MCGQLTFPSGSPTTVICASILVWMTYTEIFMFLSLFLNARAMYATPARPASAPTFWKYEIIKNQESEIIL